METVFIYALVDPRNEQVRYIGKSKDPIDRYRNHYNSARDKNTHKRNWINNLRKDGLRPELLVIDEVESDNWVFWECFYISLYKSYGFNLVNYTSGGDGSTFGNNGSFKIGNVPHNKGVPRSEETKIKLRNALIGKSNKHSYKPIIQYDLQYNQIKKFKCIKDAIDESSGFFSAGKISNCLKGKRPHHRNFIWKYDDGSELLNIKVERKIKTGRSVYQYDKDYTLLNVFISLEQAARHVGAKSSNILFCCKNENRRAKGFYWRYKQIE